MTLYLIGWAAYLVCILPAQPRQPWGVDAVKAVLLAAWPVLLLASIISVLADRANDATGRR